MHRRINICLPEETINLIDQVAGRGRRSRLIDASVKQYIRRSSKRKLRQALEEGYARWAERDRQMAEEWFPLEEEVAEGGKR